MAKQEKAPKLAEGEVARPADCLIVKVTDPTTGKSYVFHPKRVHKFTSHGEAYEWPSYLMDAEHAEHHWNYGFRAAYDGGGTVPRETVKNGVKVVPSDEDVAYALDVRRTGIRDKIARYTGQVEGKTVPTGKVDPVARELQVIIRNWADSKSLGKLPPMGTSVASTNAAAAQLGATEAGLANALAAAQANVAKRAGTDLGL